MREVDVLEMAQSNAKVEVKDESKKQMTVYNAMKHGKYAKVPLLCDVCHHRSKEVGGSGKCPQYKEKSTCTVRDDLHVLISKYNTRDPDMLKGIAQDVIHILFERFAFAEFTSQMDGNLLDKSTLAQGNLLLKYIKLQSELGAVTVTATETSKETSDANVVRELMKSLKVEQSG